VPSARTPSKWPYRAAKPGRSRRVVKTEQQQPRGVQHRAANRPTAVITAGQGRALLFAMLLAGVVAAAWWFYKSPYATLQEVRVAGVSQLSEQQVRDTANIDGASTFRVDTAAAERRLEALPQVRAATIEKHGWTGATITIEERAPWGSWQINGVNVPIDDQGYVVEGLLPPEGAPVIVEVDPQRAIKAGDRLDPGAVQLAARLMSESERALGRTVVTFAYRQSAGLTAVLSGADIDSPPLWVTFGDSRDYDYKIAALYVLLEQARGANVKLSSVDLRFGSRLSFN
jgi:cell division septal protein FtsQ